MVFIAPIKSWPKSKLGRKRFIWFTLLDHSPSLEEVAIATQAGLEPGGRGHGGGMLTGLLLWLA